MIQPLLEARAKNVKKFDVFVGYEKTRLFAFGIYWPLGTSFVLIHILTVTYLSKKNQERLGWFKNYFKFKNMPTLVCQSNKLWWKNIIDHIQIYIGAPCGSLHLKFHNCNHARGHVHRVESRWWWDVPLLSFLLPFPMNTYYKHYLL